MQSLIEGGQVRFDRRQLLSSTVTLLLEMQRTRRYCRPPLQLMEQLLHSPTMKEKVGHASVLHVCEVAGLVMLHSESSTMVLPRWHVTERV